MRNFNTLKMGLFFLLAIMPKNAESAQFAFCKFSDYNLSFAGTITEQTQCLLRAVKPHGSGSKKQTIPSFLTKRVGKSIGITEGQLDAFLKKQSIARSSIGGSPFNTVSSATGKDHVKRKALYFVIHDTSSPDFPETGGFPSNMNSELWPANSVGPGFWKGVSTRVNVIVNRIGASHTFVDFKSQRPKIATKLERKQFAAHSKGRFLHVENIQPRLKPSGSWAHIAPTPGFTDKQLERLALIYISASVRAKYWMIPAFHFNIDHKISPTLHAHDDPQNFELSRWIEKVESLTNQIAVGESLKRKSATAFGSSLVCKEATFSAVLNRAGNNVKIPLPAKGRFFGEGHYVTKVDTGFSKGKYPKPMSPQPVGYPPPVQCDEKIDSHLDRSLKLYRKHVPSITKGQLYPDKWALWWTPEEGGKCGQGSVGNFQLRELTPKMEMWFLTMNWAKGHRPARGSRFLVRANGKAVVVISGYETGPGSVNKLGGVTREVHHWLGTNNNSQIRVAYLQDQNALIGPVTCN